MAAEDYSNNLSTALVLNLNTVIQKQSLMYFLEQWFSKENRTFLYNENLVQKFQDSTR